MKKPRKGFKEQNEPALLCVTRQESAWGEARWVNELRGGVWILSAPLWGAKVPVKRTNNACALPLQERTLVIS